MKATHTSAPWKIGVRQPSSDKFIYGPLGEEIADCDRLLNTPQENLGNARLIAAAPELLAALQECSDLLEQWWEENGSPVHATESALWNAWRAIDKATGGEVK
jgi:hypothetical protein